MKAACRHIIPDLPEYIEGKISDENGQAIREHIDVCTSCRKEMEELREILASISSKSAFSRPSEGYWNTIVPRIHEKMDSRQQRYRFIPGWVYRILIPMTAAVIITVALYRGGIFSSVSLEQDLRTAVQQMTNEERSDVLHDFTVGYSESFDEYPAGDSLLVPYRSDITEAVKSGTLEYTLAPFENQFAPELLLESLSTDEVEQVLTKLQTDPNITS